MSQIKSLFGGRLAEELIFGPAYVTTGASNDIERATDIARNMVTKWGLSSKLGPLTYSEDDGEVFLGRCVTRHKQVSDVTAHAIDEEIKELIDTCYGDARRILQENEDKLHTMAEALIRYETIDEGQIRDIMSGQEPRPPANWDEPSEPGAPSRAEPESGDGKPAPLGGPAGQH
jgi:cell division protease FtsH